MLRKNVGSKRHEEIEQLSILHNADVCKLLSLANIVGRVKYRRLYRLGLSIKSRRQLIIILIWKYDSRRILPVCNGNGRIKFRSILLKVF
jgi:hypothetical protein